MSDIYYVTSPYDIFKATAAENPELTTQEALENTRYLINRVDTNIFRDEYAILYQIAKWCAKNEMPMTREVVQQLMLNSKTDILQNDKVMLGSDSSGDERFSTILEYTIAEYDSLTDADFEDYSLEGITNLYIETWAKEQAQQLMLDYQQILTGSLRVGRTIYSGRKDADLYYKRKYEIIDNLVDENKDYLGDDIDTSEDTAAEIQERIRRDETDAEYLTKFGFPKIDDKIIGLKRKEQLVIVGGSGVGKSIDSNTILETPQGKRKASEIKVGDYLFDRKGQPTKVLGVYPQGVTKRYKVTLNDGRDHNLSPDHLVPYLENDKLTETPLENIINSVQRYKYRIPHNEQVNYKERDHKVHPYVVGYLLASDRIQSNQLTINFKDKNVFDNFTEKAGLLKPKGYTFEGAGYYKFPLELEENDIYDKIKNEYGVPMRDSWGKEITVELKDHTELLQQFLSYYNLKKGTPYIPNKYLYDSAKNRKELLKGLMDFNGHVKRDYEEGAFTYTFRTKHKTLAKNVEWLARSLGYGSTLIQQTPKYTCSDKVVNIYWQVEIFTKEDVFHNKYNLRLKDNFEYKSTRDQWNIIVDIEEIPDGETVCFLVDNEERLFLMNDFIVTHNTRFAIGTVGYNALMAGHNVLHISLEQVPTRVFPIYQARHLAEQNGTRPGLTDKDILNGTYPPEYETAVQESLVDLVENPAYGKLRVVGRELFVDDIENYLNNIYDTFKFDVVILDYFGLIGSRSSKSRYNDLAEAANKIKSLCKYFKGAGFLAVVPNQLTREEEAKILKGDDTTSKLGGAASSDLIRGADLSITLTESVQNKEDNQIKLKVDKLRLGDVPNAIMLDTAKGYSMFIESEDGEENII